MEKASLWLGLLGGWRCHPRMGQAGWGKPSRGWSRAVV